MADAMARAQNRRLDPSVLIADASEERRHLLMQYVAIEWPHAAITEISQPIHALAAGEGAALTGCDLVVVGLGEQEASDTGWLDAIRAHAHAPVVVAMIDGPPAAAQAMLQRGVYCQDRRNVSTAHMRKTLRAALREHLSGTGAPDNTTIINTGLLGDAPTHPIQLPSLKRVQIRGYQLLRKLGRGGMSEVYLAQSSAKSRLCALKILPGEGVSASVLDLFIEECGVVSELDSPYVVKIFEHGVTDECL